jgi:hypothetical protein
LESRIRHIFYELTNAFVVDFDTFHLCAEEPLLIHFSSHACLLLM